MTADAIRMQKPSVKAVVDQNADYVLPVKENQSGLLTDIKLLFAKFVK